MKTLSSLLALGLVVCLVLLFSTRTKLEAEKASTEQISSELTQAKAAVDQLSTPASAPKQRQSNPTKAEVLELARLRNEVAQSRRYSNELATVAAIQPQPTTRATRANQTEPVTVDQSSGAPLPRPEHPELRPAYELARLGQIDLVKKALDEHPEFLNLQVGGAQSTLLHTAAYNSQPEMVEELLRRGANVNTQNRDGHTPLYDVVLKGDTKSAKLLLEAGADFSIADKDGLTPLQLALQRQRPEFEALLRAKGAK
jgi:hypothetical protein